MGFRVLVDSGLVAGVAQSSHMLSAHGEQARADDDQYREYRRGWKSVWVL